MGGRESEGWEGKRERKCRVCFLEKRIAVDAPEITNSEDTLSADAVICIVL